jgi:hypothetical protein
MVVSAPCYGGGGAWCVAPCPCRRAVGVSCSCRPRPGRAGSSGGVGFVAEFAAPFPGRIFVSYRREETAWPARQLFDRLANRYGVDQVFKDVDSIDLGDDFVEAITRAVGSCDVLLALVGEGWLTITDVEGRRRLDDPDDFVRLEIEAALTRNVRVIPILVDAARLPSADDLPTSLAGLVRRQALELSPARFEYDTSRLWKVLDKTLAEVHTGRLDAAAISARAGTALGPSEPKPPTAPEQREQSEPSRTPRIPPPAAAMPRADRRRSDQTKPPDKGRRRVSRRALILAVTAVAAVVLAVASLWPTGSPVWRSIDPLDDPVDWPGVVAVGGELWVVGGLLPAEEGQEVGRAVDTVQIYDPELSQWRTGPPLRQPLDHAAVATDGQAIFVIGGQTDDDGKKAVVPDVWMLDLDKPEPDWEPLAPLPGPRAAGAAAWDGERLVFAGGFAERCCDVASSEVWALEGSGWIELGHLQHARHHLAAATDGEGKVWFLGGSGPDRLGLVDIVTDDSIEPGPQVTPINAPAAVWHPSTGVCLLGGNIAANDTTNAVTCPESQGTRPWPALPDDRGGAGAAILGSDVYVVGGYGDGVIFTADVQVLEFG